MDYKSFRNALLLGEANYSFTSAFCQEFDGNITATEYGDAESIATRYFDGDPSQLQKWLEQIVSNAESSSSPLCAGGDARIKIMASVNARSLGKDDATCLCERWNGKSWDAPSSFWEHQQQPTNTTDNNNNNNNNHTIVPFDLIIFNFPHTGQCGRAPKLLRALFKQARLCVEQGRLTPNVVIEMRLRDDDAPGHRKLTRVAYQHEEAAAYSQFALLGAYESDLDHWHQLGYRHRTTRKNVDCRGMPCKVWRWCLQESLPKAGGAEVT